MNAIRSFLGAAPIEDQKPPLLFLDPLLEELCRERLFLEAMPLKPEGAASLSWSLFLLNKDRAVLPGRWWRCGEQLIDWPHFGTHVELGLKGN